ncbi:hypothetical protein F5141DRAFT_1060128 [Pisolithus sp. B1]|nr:hypothetical protein F5141DRAFT_1060128 [Pisolithus sp. B1]
MLFKTTPSVGVLHQFATPSVDLRITHPLTKSSPTSGDCGKLARQIQRSWLKFKNISTQVFMALDAGLHEMIGCYFMSVGWLSQEFGCVDAGWYDPDNMLQLMVFHWVFIPWLQVELNSYQDHINNSQKCCDKRKVLPHGIPELIYTCAEDYGALDFKVMVSPAAIEQECYLQLGHPSIGCTSVWNVYHNILDLMQHCTDVPAILVMTEDHVTEDTEEVNLLPGLQDLHEMEGYMGSMANGLGLHK